MHRAVAAFGILALVAGGSAPAQDVSACPGGAARAAIAVTVDGPVEILRGTGRDALTRGTALCPGDRVRTGEGGRAELRFLGRDTTIGLTGNSSLQIPAAPGAESGDVTLTSGLLRFVSSVRGLFTVGTRYANAGIDGTEAVVAVSAAGGGGTLVLVREGVVQLAGREGAAIALTAGDAGFAAAGGAARAAEPDSLPGELRPLLLDQEGASDWAIYYPPILLGADISEPRLDAARARLLADDPNGAEALLAQVPALGETGAAALALRSVVALLRGRREDGAALANRAVATAPGLGAAHIARSYALQAAGELEPALAAAARGAELAPADAYARARQAELELTLGRRATARATAEAANAIAPTPLGLAIEGFAALSVYEDAAAMAAFETAVAAEDSAPLPRLGMGLALIRSGAIAAGRRELELAASLDPKRGQLRTWLGRAYFEEGRGEKAAAQFDLAKALDPDDPTPWLFSAAERYAAGQPLQALQEIDEAEARAPARSVLRGAEGLAEDRAVTAAALGRALDEAGFTETALDQGARAVEHDPTNATAHRVLADLLVGAPELTFARSSSALLAQVLSPPTLAPIDVALAEPDLALLESSGPARASFGEFTPFFDSYGTSARLGAFAGTQGTFGDSVSVTHAASGVSVGFGQSFYETSGYRFNNDVSHHLLSLEARAELAPELTVFGEIGHRRTNAGDRSLSFDFALDDPFTDSRDIRSRVRTGFHARPAPGQDVIGVATLRTQDFDLREDNGAGSVFGFGPTFTHTTIKSKGIDLQGQHIGRFGNLTTIAGASFTQVDRQQTGSIDLGFFAQPFAFTDDLRHVSGYAYGTYRLPLPGFFTALEATLGVSIDHLALGEGLAATQTEIHPKLGLRLDLAGGLSLRAAYTETTTPDLLFDQRIEPVTVAGFAQFRPEASGTGLRQAQGGIDYRLTPWLTLGATGAWREIEDVDAVDVIPNTAEEVEGALYAHARLGSRISARLRLSHLDVDSDLAADPDSYELTRMGGELRYFDPSGFFARFGLEYVDFDSIDNNGEGRISDDFVLGAIGLGFRLPDQRGVVSLDLTNAFDQDFAFRERPIRALGAANVLDPVFPRDFTALARVTLAF